MRFKRGLLAVSLFYLGASFISPGPVQAQSAASFSPVSPWQIKKIHDNKAAGPPYCALARQFRPQSLLTFARNVNEESSLAIDFTTPKFMTDRKYYILLDPGMGMQRAFEVRPVSERAMVIRMGYDPDFFAALESTGYMRVKVGNQLFTYQLPDIVSGTTELQECVLGMMSPAAGPGAQGPQNVNATEMFTPLPEDPPSLSMSAAASTPPVPQTAGYRQMINRLRSQLAELRSENRSLIGSLNSVQTAAGPEAEPLPAPQPASNQKDDIVIQTLMTRVSRLESEKAALQDELSETRRNLTGNEEVARYRQQINKLMLENAELQAKVQNVYFSEADIEELTEKIAGLQQDNEALRAAASAAREAADEAGRAQIFQLEEENRLLQQRLAEIGDLESMTGALQAKNVRLEKENRALNDRITDMLEASVRTPSAEDLLAARQKEWNRERQNYEARLTRSETEIEDLKATIARLESEKAAINDELLSLQTMANQNGEATVAALKAENRRLQQMMTDQATDFDSHDLRAEIEELRARNKAISAQLAKARQPVPQDSQRVKSLQIQNDSLRRRVAALEKDNARLAAQEAQLVVMQAENEDLKSANLALSRQAREQGQRHSRESSQEKQPRPLPSPISKDTFDRDFQPVAAPQKSQDIEMASIEPAAGPLEGQDNQPPQTLLPVEDLLDKTRIAEQDIPVEEAQSVVQPSDITPVKQRPQRPLTEAERQEREMMASIQKGAPRPTASSYEDYKALEGESAEPLQVSRQASFEDLEVTDVQEDRGEVKIEELPVEELAEASFSLRDLIVDAGLVRSSDLVVLDGAGRRDFISGYQWDNGTIVGTAEQRTIPAGSSFEDLAKTYLNGTEELCADDFAIMPGHSIEDRGFRLDSYELACIGPSSDTTAAILFLSYAGQFAIIAQEAPSAGMAQAMEKRDRVVAFIAGRSGA